jgi:outer membrane protein OmpA-like peptidoglycan-associated protein
MRGIVAVLILGASVRIAAAQGLDAARFVPAAGTAGGLMVERPAVAGHLDWGVGLFLNLADDALVRTDRDSGAVLSRPVDTAFTADVLASIGVLDRLELALHLPAHIYYDGDTLAAGGELLQASAGLGDLRVVPKLALMRSDTFALSAALPVTFPTGDENGLRGAGLVTVEPRVLVGILQRRLGVSLNAGFRIRPGLDALDPVGHEITAGAGVAYALLADRDVLDLLAELVAAWDVSRDGDELTDVPLELLAGVAIKPGPAWQFYVGGGLGVTDGLGTPDFRVIAGLRYAPHRAGGTPYQDSDGDGIADAHDRCPDQAEDADGFEDDDGCPEGDNDGDGILDDDDECPDMAEEKGGDRDGCPERGRVVVSEGKIFIIGKVQFETGSAEIKPKSRALVDDIAVALNDNPSITKIEIQGHTDNAGGDSVNQQLSQKRAESVKKRLVERGVAEDRLVARGYGEKKPVAPNKTRAGRAKNRRVEFVVLD